MGTHRLQFYATKGDLAIILSAVESEAPPMRYAPQGSFATDKIVMLNSLRHKPDLGIATSPESIGNRAYSVLDACHPIAIVSREHNDKVWYSCDLGGYSAVTFRPAGVLAEGTLILSEVNVLSADAETLERFDLFRKEIARQSTTVQSVQVCKEAEILLDRGWILTDMANAAIKRQLKRQ